MVPCTNGVKTLKGIQYKLVFLCRFSLARSVQASYQIKPFELCVRGVFTIWLFYCPAQDGRAFHGTLRGDRGGQDDRRGLRGEFSSGVAFVSGRQTGFFVVLHSWVVFYRYLSPLQERSLF